MGTEESRYCFLWKKLSYGREEFFSLLRFYGIGDYQRDVLIYMLEKNVPRSLLRAITILLSRPTRPLQFL